MVEKGSFEIKVNQADEYVYIAFKGFFQGDDGIEFIKQYQDASHKVKKEQTDLLIDGSKLNVFPMDKKEANIEFYRDYATFRHVYIIAPQSAASKMQLHSCLREAGVEHKFEFVTTLPKIK